MSKLKVTTNLFLEVAEINRLVQFLKKDGYELAIKSLVKSFGIVTNAANSNYKVVAKAGADNVVTINSGLAFDSQMRAIRMETPLDLTVANTGSTRWIVLQYGSTNFEAGTVSVTADGTLQGTGTSFLSVLRGQPNFPTKVRLNSLLNTEYYEVVEVTNDTSAVLSGSFVAESNVQYAVMGAFTPGFQPAEDNKLIYEMDAYSIQIIDSADVPPLTDDQFILASVEFSGSGMVITDRRSGYMFNSSFYSSRVLPEKDEIVSLTRVQRIQPNIIELTVEHAYTVTDFTVVTTTSSTIFRIVAGQSNFLGTGDIPNGLFKNWTLINRNNMKKITIDDNTNKDLYVSQFDDDIIAGDTSQFIVVPPYEIFEYMLTFAQSGNVTLQPDYHLVSQGSGTNKLLVTVPYGQITLGFRFRMINGDVSTAWQKFSIAEFTNEAGNKQMIGDSQIIVNSPQPTN